MVPIGYPGPIHSPGLHLDMYTATALLSAIVGVVNIVLLIVVFKEHTVPDEVLVPSIQGSGKLFGNHYENLPMQYTEHFSAAKNLKVLRIFFFLYFLIFAQKNKDCGYSLEPPRRGGSNEYPQSMFWSKNKKTGYTPAYPHFFLYKSGVLGD